MASVVGLDQSVARLVESADCHPRGFCDALKIGRPLCCADDGEIEVRRTGTGFGGRFKGSGSRCALGFWCTSVFSRLAMLHIKGGFRAVVDMYCWRKVNTEICLEMNHVPVQESSHKCLWLWDKAGR